MATTSSLQNINWLSKKVWAVYIKGKNVYCPSLIPSQYNVFLYFLEGQIHKNNKLGIMTNVGKTRLVKDIFTSIHKISDACANSFGRYIMIAQCMRNVLWKNDVSEKIKARPSTSSITKAPTFSILFEKIVSLTPI